MTKEQYGELRKLLNLSTYEVRLKGMLSQNDIVSNYSTVISSYLSGDLEKLLTSIVAFDQFPESSEKTIFLKLSHIRWQIRTHQVNEDLLKEILNEIFPSPLLQGESLFVVARAYECMKMHEQAKEYYHSALMIFESEGLERLAVRSLLNFFAMESRINLKRKMIPDYLMVAQKAITCEELSVAGIAFLNVSRDLQEYGAFYSALHYCLKSLECLEKQGRGSLDYDLILAHQCDLLLDLQRKDEAFLIYEQLITSPFEEVKNARKVLEKKINLPVDNIGVLTTGWQLRLENLKNQKKIKLTEMEDKVLRILSAGKKTKYELIDELYDEKIELKLLEDRLKNILMRLRKKLPNLIGFEDGKYFLTDEDIIKMVI